MPSFNCDGCGDVVKKPKLDSHSMRCRASVTCLDCSTTFNGPASWKNHTSCISEAQKYQKSLYKAPKNKNPKEQQTGSKHNPASATQVIPATVPTVGSKSDNPSAPLTLPHQASKTTLNDDQEKMNKQKDKKDAKKTLSEESVNSGCKGQRSSDQYAQTTTTKDKKRKIKEDDQKPAGQDAQGTDTNGQTDQPVSKKKKHKKHKTGADPSKGGESVNEQEKTEKSEKRSDEKSDYLADVNSLLISINQEEMLKISQGLVCAANGRPMTLQKLIDSIFNYLLNQQLKKQDNQLDSANHLSKKNKKVLRSKITDVLLEHLGVVSIDKKNSLGLMWNGTPLT